MKQKFQFKTFSIIMQSSIVCATCALANCASNTQAVPISTAWKNIDLSETSLRKATKQLQNSLLAAAKELARRFAPDRQHLEAVACIEN